MSYSGNKANEDEDESDSVHEETKRPGSLNSRYVTADRRANQSLNVAECREEAGCRQSHRWVALMIMMEGEGWKNRVERQIEPEEA